MEARGGRTCCVRCARHAGARHGGAQLGPARAASSSPKGVALLAWTSAAVSLVGALDGRKWWFCQHGHAGCPPGRSNGPDPAPRRRLLLTSILMPWTSTNNRSDEKSIPNCRMSSPLIGSRRLHFVRITGPGLCLATPATTVEARRGWGSMGSTLPSRATLERAAASLQHARPAAVALEARRRVGGGG